MFLKSVQGNQHSPDNRSTAASHVAQAGGKGAFGSLHPQTCNITCLGLESQILTKQSHRWVQSVAAALELLIISHYLPKQFAQWPRYRRCSSSHFKTI